MHAPDDKSEHRPDLLYNRHVFCVHPVRIQSRAVVYPTVVTEQRLLDAVSWRMVLKEIHFIHDSGRR